MFVKLFKPMSVLKIPITVLRKKNIKARDQTPQD